MYRYIISDEYRGFIRKPSAFYFSIQRGFSGSLLTLPSAWTGKQWAPYEKIVILIIQKGSLDGDLFKKDIVINHESLYLSNRILQYKNR